MAIARTMGIRPRQQSDSVNKCGSVCDLTISSKMGAIYQVLKLSLILGAR